MSNYSVKNAANKWLLLAAAGIVFIVLLWALFGTGNLVHPVMFWLVFLASTLGFAYYTYKYGEGENKKGLPIGFILVAAGYLILNLVVLSNAKESRAQCIPKEQLTYNNGRIIDAEKYISFYEDCPSNPLLLDEVTKAYIRKYNELPSWHVKDGYTKDAVGWMKAHDLYTPELVEHFSNNPTGKIPEQYLKK